MEGLVINILSDNSLFKTVADRGIRDGGFLLQQNEMSDQVIHHQKVIVL